MRYDLIVVGGGLFGRIISAAALACKRSVLVLDDARPHRGSAPAACLIKPGWLSSMSRRQIDDGLMLLDELYGLDTLDFQLPVGTARLNRVDPLKILATASHVLYETVEHCKESGIVRTISCKTLESKKTVLATGHWRDICRDIPVTTKFGVAFRAAGQTVPAIKLWAPYKQLVQFNDTPKTVWVGDGTALNAWSEQAEAKSEARCRAAVGLRGDWYTRQIGARPYVAKEHLNGEPCYVRQQSKNVWVATGGAKNGTMAAAWAARTLMEKFKWM